MLSVIISTYKPNLFESVSKNIESTIGIPHEIIRIDNPGKMGICEAYNLGATKAKYPYLLFVHDDAEFKTNNWGKVLISHINRPNIGVIGLVGSNYVPKAPSSWYIKDLETYEPPFDETGKKKSVTLDGVFLAISKQNFIRNKFNEEIKGFHGYDTHFCLQTAKSLNNYCINDIEIRHFSGGNPDKNHLDNNIQIRDLYGYDYNKTYIPQLEYNAFVAFVKSYFVHYPVNNENLKFTLKYFPGKLSLKHKLKIFKLFLDLFRYKKQYNSRLQK